MKRVFLAFITLVLAVCYLPAPVYALGAAMAPATMDIADALRGGEYERSITVFNPSTPESAYNLRTEGDAGKWFSFLDLDNRKPVQQVLVPAQSSVSIIVMLNIPPEAANGSYTATIYAETAPIDISKGSGVSAVMQAKSDVTIGVTGTQKVEGAVGSITVHDVEVGMPAHFIVNFANRGNVAARPAINCRISQGKDTIAELKENKTPVNPGAQGDIGLDWDTTGVKPGDYIAEFAVSLEGQLLTSQKVFFKVASAGTFTMSGELTGIRYTGEAVLGQTTKLMADFKNTGEADTKAKLSIEVNKDGALVDVIKSEEVLVPMGKTGTLTVYFKPAEKGSYTLNGVVNFAGKQSNEKVINIKLGAGQGNGVSGLPWPIIGGAALALVIIGGAVVVIKRRK